MLKKIISILGKKRGKIYLLLAFLALLGAVMDMLLTYIVLPFVSIIMEPAGLTELKIADVLSTWGIVSKEEQIFVFATGIAIAYVLRNVYMLSVNFLRCRFIASCKSYVSTRLFNAISNRPYAYFTTTNTSSIQKICINDITRLFSVMDAILNIFSGLITAFMIVAVLLVTDPVLTIAAVGIVILMTAIVNRPIAKKAWFLSKDYSYHYTKMLQWTQQFVGSTKAIITNKKQSYFQDKFSYHNARFTKNEGNYSAIANLTGYIMNAVIMGLVFFYIAILAKTGADIEDKIPVLALFAMASLKIMPSIATMTSLINNIRYNEEGVNIIYDQMNQVNEDKSSFMEKKKGVLSIPQSLTEGISVVDVTFGYKDSKDYIFRDLSMQIPSNKSVAFIGATGAGKTTLADIILGLQRPVKGKILVDGKDISQHDAWWACQIGYIPQTIYLCEDTLRSNIAFGIPDEEIDDEKVLECMKKAQIYDFIQSLPEKEYTVAGENGVRLSGGQRQRIGIARALYNDPPFIVLDEATSALDGETEKAIIDTINSFAGEKTMLIIAHRLSTIEKCDMVFKIEDGKAIRQRG